jgi:hypothetical protein
MAGTAWPSLAAGNKAKASEVEQKFDWLEGSVVPMNSGSTTDLAYDLGTTTARWRSVYAGSINGTSTAGGVAIGTTTANASSLLDIAGTKSLVVPRLSTAQRDALTGADGMFIYNSTTARFEGHKNGAWTPFGGTVFRTNAPTETSVLTQSVTATVVSVASGGGRINAIMFKRGVGTPNTAYAPQVIIDGTTISLPEASTSGVWYVTPDASIVHATGFTLPSSNIFYSATSFDAPYLGWDFATSLSINLQGPGGVTVTCRVVYSSVV